MSELDKRVSCIRHGTSRMTYVCGHAARRESVGFNFDAIPDDPWPDAWCDRCEQMRLRDGGWTEENGKLAELTFVCGACWEACYELANPHELPDAEAARRVEDAFARVDPRQQAMIERMGFDRHGRYHYDPRTGTFDSVLRPSLPSGARAS